MSAENYGPCAVQHCSAWASDISFDVPLCQRHADLLRADLADRHIKEVEAKLAELQQQRQDEDEQPE